MRRFLSSKKLSCDCINLQIKLPENAANLTKEQLKECIRKSIKMSFAHKFKSPKDLERYSKEKKGNVPPLPPPPKNRRFLA